MSLLELIKRHKDNKIAKNQKIAEERARLIQEKQERNEKLLNSYVTKDYVLTLIHNVADSTGYIKYHIYDYFLCNVKHKDMEIGGQYKATKISGDNFGEEYKFCVEATNGLRNQGRVRLMIKDNTWYGDISVESYIPERCKTITDLNNYMNEVNAKAKQEYEVRLRTKQAKNGFFR